VLQLPRPLTAVAQTAAGSMSPRLSSDGQLLCLCVTAAGLYSVQCRKLQDLLTAASQAAVQQLLQIVCNAASDSTLQIADDYAVSVWVCCRDVRGLPACPPSSTQDPTAPASSALSSA
jgi:hypothetical protein